MKIIGDLRTRWAAIGAACAIAIGGGGLSVVSAVGSTSDNSVFVAIQSERVLDTRSGSIVKDRTIKLDIEGNIKLIDGKSRQVVPVEATSVAINLTVTEGIKNGKYGFVTVFPCTTVNDPVPNSSSINFENGIDIANGLTIATSSIGSVCLSVHGSAHLIVDIGGYFKNHNHDDRYYTETEVDQEVKDASAASVDQAVKLAVEIAADQMSGRTVSSPWSTSSKIIDSKGDVGSETSVAIGIDGNPIIAYYDVTNGDLKVASCDTPACATTTVATIDSTNNVGRTPSITIGANGHPVISYLDYTNFDLKLATCMDASCSKVSIAVVDSVGEVGWFSSVAIGRNGNPVISYADQLNGDLKIAICTRMNCTTAIIQSLGSDNEEGEHTSIAIGVDGNPIISFLDRTNYDLRVAACVDVNCENIAVRTVDSEGSVGLSPSLAIGNDGFPVISYLDAEAFGLRVAKCADITCSSAEISTIDDSTLVGYGTSIAIGSNGNPVVAYTGTETGAAHLRVALCLTANCTSATFTVVEAGGITGQFPSIAVGVGGAPMVSFYDRTNGDLKIANIWWMVGGR